MKRFIDDRRGAIMVIAIFMSSFLVGAIWYMLGIGEAIIYREQLRAAADATAFDTATVHALGMNMISMINIVMAAVMAVLILLTLVFFIAVAVTLLLTACAFIPLFGAACVGGISPMIQFDIRMFQLTNKYRDKIAAPAIGALDASERAIAIAMPWVGKLVSKQVADAYPKGVTETDAFSVSMIPTNFKIYHKWREDGSAGNYTEKLDNAIASKLPIVGKMPTGPISSLPDLKRYGLPVEDDKFSILCTHGGMVLVNGFRTLVTAFIGDNGVADAMSDGFDKFGEFFGMIVGQMPGMFCSGLSPTDMLYTVLGKVPVIGWLGKHLINLVMGNHPKLKQLENGDTIAFGKMAPLKPFDMASNGNGWMQVWASIKGNPEATRSANTGVLVPSWGLAQTRSGAEPGDNVDFAQAEFYYDCGAPDSGSNQTVLGFGDTGGDWGSCKYNAMWNMRWKSRLRRYHEFKYDILKSIELFVWNGSGAERFLETFGNKLIPGAGGGAFFKVQVIDRIKACFTGLGSGNSNCPLPLPSGAGKISVGVGTGADYDLQNEVFH